MLNYTTSAYKDIHTSDSTKEILKKVEDNRKKSNKENAYNVAVFFKTAKQHLCFRECAKIVKIAEATGCEIHLAAGDKRGSTKSLLSFLHLGIVPGTPITLTIRGRDTYTAFHRCLEILEGKEETSIEEA